MTMLLLLLLTIKHFVLDFVYQPPYMWQNKGTYGHPGGLLHAGLHAVGSLVILLFFANPYLALALAGTEYVIHYHMDWFKMWYNRKRGWACNTHPEFWVLTGFDQFVHSLTYILIVWLAFF